MFGILLFAGFFGFGDACLAEADLLINEILVETADDPRKEFIELYNSSDADIALDGFKLKKKVNVGTSESYLVSAAKFTGTIYAHDFFVITVPEYKDLFAADLAYSGASYSIASNNTLLLYDKSNALVTSLTYADNEKDHSYSFNGKGYAWTSVYTPGAKNEFAPDIPKSSPESEMNDLKITVKISQANDIYPSMDGSFTAEITDEKNNTLQLSRVGKSYAYACNISPAQACDTPTLKFTWNFGDNHKSYLFPAKHKYVSIGNYNAVLTISDGSKKTIKNFTVNVSAFPKFKLKITNLAPNPKGKDTKKEYIEIKNSSKKKVNLKGWSIATGWKKLVNHPIRKDFTIKPGQSKKITSKYASFTLNNTKSKIELRNPAGKVVAKIKYSDKDGVQEDALYAKFDDQWQWQTPAAETAAAPAEINTAPLAEVIAQSEIFIEDPAIQENLGKFSTADSGRQNKIVLLSYATSINSPPSLAEPPGRVLGAATVRENSGVYNFTAPVVPKKNRLVKFTENLFVLTNSFINNFFLKLSL